MLDIAHDENSNILVCYMNDEDEEDKLAAKQIISNIVLPLVRYQGKVYSGKDAWKWASKISYTLYDVDEEDISRYEHTLDEIKFFMWLKE
jgi:hypothetical protein